MTGQLDGGRRLGEQTERGSIAVSARRPGLAADADRPRQRTCGAGPCGVFGEMSTILSALDSIPEPIAVNYPSDSGSLAFMHITSITNEHELSLHSAHENTDPRF